MRFLTRIHALGAFILCCILYLGWIYPSLKVGSRLNKAWYQSYRRVVVFGDSWSDTTKYLVAPPTEELRPVRDPEQGKVWTEVLCEELVCDSVDNFARSLTYWKHGTFAGAVVDNVIFNNKTFPNSTQENPLSDLKTQVLEWINFEQQKESIPGRQGDKEWTVFTILFGVWDVWNYASLKEDDAKNAVDQTVEEIMEQLDILAERALSPIQVVIPKMVDISFLPRFTSRPVGQPGVYLPMDQKAATYLVTHWNDVLEQAAGKWALGDIFMPDMNQFLAGLMRENQLYTLGIKDHNGAGKKTPLFKDIRTPCLALSGTGPETHDELGEHWLCDDAKEHLFWDGMHITGPAHEKFGKVAADLITANTTVNARARELKAVVETDSNKQAET